MIRGAPSIWTTGIAGDSTSWKYGSRPASRAARISATRSWPRIFSKTSGAVGHIGWVG